MNVGAVVFNSEFSAFQFGVKMYNRVKGILNTSEFNKEKDDCGHFTAWK